MLPSLLFLLFMLLPKTLSSSCSVSCYPPDKCTKGKDGDSFTVKCANSLIADGHVYGKEKTLTCNERKTGPFWRAADQPIDNSTDWRRISNIECTDKVSCLVYSPLVSECRGSKQCAELDFRLIDQNDVVRCSPDYSLFITDPDMNTVHKVNHIYCDSTRGEWRGAVEETKTTIVHLQRGWNARCVRELAEDLTVLKGETLLLPEEEEALEIMNRKPFAHLTTSLIFFVSVFFFAYKIYAGRKSFNRRWKACLKENKPYRPLPVSGRHEGVIEFEKWNKKPGMRDKLKKKEKNKKEEEVEYLDSDSSCAYDDVVPEWIIKKEEIDEKEEMSTAASMTEEEWSCCSSSSWEYSDEEGEEGDGEGEGEKDDDEEEKEEGDGQNSVPVENENASGVGDEDEDEDSDEEDSDPDSDPDSSSDSFSYVDDLMEMQRKRRQPNEDQYDSCFLMEKFYMRDDWAYEGVEASISENDVEQSIRFVERGEAKNENEEEEPKKEEVAPVAPVTPAVVPKKAPSKYQKAGEKVTLRARLQSRQSVRTTEETGPWARRTQSGTTVSGTTTQGTTTQSGTTTQGGTTTQSGASTGNVSDTRDEKNSGSI